MFRFAVFSWSPYLSILLLSQLFYLYYYLDVFYTYFLFFQNKFSVLGRINDYKCYLIQHAGDHCTLGQCLKKYLHSFETFQQSSLTF